MKSTPNFIARMFFLLFAFFVLTACEKKFDFPFPHPTGDKVYKVCNKTVYEFYKVPRGPVFDEMDMYWRHSSVSLPTGVHASPITIMVFVKWTNNMEWEPVSVCGRGLTCTIIDRFSTVDNNIVNVYLRDDPFYPTGSAGDTIAVKIII